MFKNKVRIGIGCLCFVFAGVGYAQDSFHGCPMEGTAKPASVRTLNTFKNRHTAPGPNDIDPKIILAAMVKKGNDKQRWSNSQAGEIMAYVADVLPGGKESVNCCNSKMSNAQCPHHDSHIALVMDPKQANDKTKHVVVEITPRWREIKQGQGQDWSHDTLRKQILHRWVKVRGWMMFDLEHVNASENTAPGGANNWRATAWEIHPVTGFEVLPSKPN